MDQATARLLDAAERRGLSDRALARLLGVSPSSVCLYRQGARNMSFKVRVAAVQHFPELHPAMFPPIPDEAVSA